MAARSFSQLTAADASTMLAFIPSDDRDLWVKVGGILKDELGETGFAVWDDWSRTSDRYVERDARDVWRSLGKNAKRAGIGTLVFLARQHGWRSGVPAAKEFRISRPGPAPSRETAAYAASLWLAASFGDAMVGGHPYASKKGISWAAGAGRAFADGKVIGRGADCLIIPIRTDGIGKVQGVQCINAEGAKQTFGRIVGGCLLLGNTVDLEVDWFVAEGWASAVSVVFHHRQGHAVCAAAFGKGNMENTPGLLSRRYGPRRIIILREAD